MHAGAKEKRERETIAGGGREGAWTLTGGRGCNQCSSRKPVGGKEVAGGGGGRASWWKAIAVFGEPGRSSCVSNSALDENWSRPAPPSWLQLQRWVGTEKEGRESYPRPGKSRDKGKKKRGRASSIGMKGRAASRKSPDDSVSVRQVAQEEATESGDWRAPLKKGTVFYWLRAHYKRPPKSKLGIPFNT